MSIYSMNTFPTALSNPLSYVRTASSRMMIAITAIDTIPTFTAKTERQNEL
jgi:hypothetical protein